MAAILFVFPMIWNVFFEKMPTTWILDLHCTVGIQILYIWLTEPFSEQAEEIAGKLLGRLYQASEEWTNYPLFRCPVRAAIQIASE